MKKITFLLTSVGATALASLSHAGGYVVPIIEAVPQVMATPGGSNTGLYVAGGALILCAIFCRGGGDRATLPPGDHGGPCFREGTLIQTERGWVRVDDLKEGMTVSTSEGEQIILSVESWVPTEYKDRPVIYRGVSLSKNHCVGIEGCRVEAQNVSQERGMIDGAAYYHVLVGNHAWLYVRGHEGSPEVPPHQSDVLVAESLMVTPDLKTIYDRFPKLAEQHAARPCDYDRVYA